MTENTVIKKIVVLPPSSIKKLIKKGEIAQAERAIRDYREFGGSKKKAQKLEEDVAKKKEKYFRNTVLQEAHAARIAGDHDLALKKYCKILKKFPRDKSALDGLYIIKKAMRIKTRRAIERKSKRLPFSPDGYKRGNSLYSGTRL